MNGYAPFLGQVRLRMGAIIVEPPQQGYAPGIAPLPTPSIPLVAKRFEIKDEEGNFIPNAAVTVTTSDGQHFLTKLSDAGGNVSMSVEEVQAAAKARGLTSGRLLYTVSAPGKASANGVFFDSTQPVMDQVGLKEVTLKQEAPNSALLVPVVVLTLIAGGILYSVFK